MLAQALAVDISLAALLGKDVYSFGELLIHPIVSPLCMPSHNSSPATVLLQQPGPKP